MGRPQINRMFSDDQVREIRKSTTKTRELARMLGVSHVTIHRIKTRQHYADVPDAVPQKEQTKNKAPDIDWTQADKIELSMKVIKTLANRAPTHDARIWLLGELKELELDAYDMGILP